MKKIDDSVMADLIGSAVFAILLIAWCILGGEYNGWKMGIQYYSCYGYFIVFDDDGCNIMVRFLDL